MKPLRTALAAALVASACVDQPVTQPPFASPDAAAHAPVTEWIRDDGPAWADFDPDTVDQYPFHIYWHGNTVPYRMKAAVRAAAYQWSVLVSPTPVEPYVFSESVECELTELRGDSVIVRLAYAEGDTLAGGFHLYVSADPAFANGRYISGFAGGPCMPPVIDESCHPNCTPPNGFIYLNRNLAERPSGAPDGHMETVAAHEIGHNLGIGIGPRWWRGHQTYRVVTPDGRTRGFNIQEDSVAVAKYVEWISTSVAGIGTTWNGEEWVPFYTFKTPYPYRKMPLALEGRHGYHWHMCTLTGGLLRSQINLTVPLMGRGGHYGQREITQVTAAMLQGFDVDWDLFPENDIDVPDEDGSVSSAVDGWSPWSENWIECPEMELTLGADSLATDRDNDEPESDIHLWNIR